MSKAKHKIARKVGSSNPETHKNLEYYVPVRRVFINNMFSMRLQAVVN